VQGDHHVALLAPGGFADDLRAELAALESDEPAIPVWPVGHGIESIAPVQLEILLANTKPA